MDRNIVQHWQLQASPAVVWECLTDPGMLADWLMPNDFRAKLGHEFTFKTKGRPGFDGTVYCKVLMLEPTQRLSYSWRGGPGDGTISLDSVVTWTLFATDAGTELKLEHTGFKGLKNYLTYIVMDFGWRKHVRNRLIKKLISNEAVTTHG